MDRQEKKLMEDLTSHNHTFSKRSYEQAVAKAEKQGGDLRDARNPFENHQPWTAEEVENLPGKIQEKGFNVAVPTPWPSINNELGGIGLVAGRMHAVGGKPGGGKTALLDQIITFNLATGRNVFLGSTEMSAYETWVRILSYGTSTPYYKLDIRTGSDTFSMDVWKKAVKKFQSYNPGILITNNEPVFNRGEDFIKMIDMLSQAQGIDIDLYCLDHLQDMTWHGYKGKKKQELDRVVEEVDKAAKRNKAAIMLLSQLKREAYDGIEHGNHHGYPPTLSDFQYTSMLEQKSYTALMLDPTRNRDIANGNFRVPLMVLKNRLQNNQHNPEFCMEVDPRYMTASVDDDTRWMPPRKGPLSKGSWAKAEYVQQEMM